MLYTGEPEQENNEPILREGIVSQRSGHLGIISRRFLMVCHATTLTHIAHIQTRILSRYQISLGAGTTFVGNDSHNINNGANSASGGSGGGEVNHKEATVDHAIPAAVARTNIGMHVLAQVTHAVLLGKPFLVNMSADLPQTTLHALPQFIMLDADVALVSEEDLGTACLFELLVAPPASTERLRFQADRSTEYLAWASLLFKIVQPARSLLPIDHQMQVCLVNDAEDSAAARRRLAKFKSVAVAASQTLKQRHSQNSYTPSSPISPARSTSIDSARFTLKSPSQSPPAAVTTAVKSAVVSDVGNNPNLPSSPTSHVSSLVSSTVISSAISGNAPAADMQYAWRRPLAMTEGQSQTGQTHERRLQQQPTIKLPQLHHLSKSLLQQESADQPSAQNRHHSRISHPQYPLNAPRHLTSSQLAASNIKPSMSLEELSIIHEVDTVSTSTSTHGMSVVTNSIIDDMHPEMVAAPTIATISNPNTITKTTVITTKQESPTLALYSDYIDKGYEHNSDVRAIPNSSTVYQTTHTSSSTSQVPLRVLSNLSSAPVQKSLSNTDVIQPNHVDSIEASVSMASMSLESRNSTDQLGGNYTVYPGRHQKEVVSQLSDNALDDTDSDDDAVLGLAYRTPTPPNNYSRRHSAPLSPQISPAPVLKRTRWPPLGIPIRLFQKIKYRSRHAQDIPEVHVEDGGALSSTTASPSFSSGPMFPRFNRTNQAHENGVGIHRPGASALPEHAPIPLLPVDPWYLKPKVQDDDAVSHISDNMMVWCKESAKWKKVHKDTPAIGR
ncbi:hypothetical protein BDV3_005685 [Batrachochytrium dendrobatidis]